MKVPSEHRAGREPTVDTYYFDNGSVENQVTVFKKENAERLVFVPNWKAKSKHWREFVIRLNQRYSVEYFESREKNNTRYKDGELSFSVEQMGDDLSHYLNQSDGPYHLVAVSIGTCSIFKAWKALKRKPTTLTLICPIIHLRMPFYFHLFRFVPEKWITRAAPTVYFLLSTSKKLKRASSAFRKSLIQNDFTELKVMRASVQEILKMRVRLDEVRTIDTPCLIIYTEDDHIHLKQEALTIADVMPTPVKTASFADFRAVHEPRCAEAVLNWGQARAKAQFA